MYHLTVTLFKFLLLHRSLLQVLIEKSILHHNSCDHFKYHSCQDLKITNLNMQGCVANLTKWKHDWSVHIILSANQTSGMTGTSSIQISNNWFQGLAMVCRLWMHGIYFLYLDSEMFYMIAEKMLFSSLIHFYCSCRVFLIMEIALTPENLELNSCYKNWESIHINILLCCQRGHK